MQLIKIGSNFTFISVVSENTIVLQKSAGANFQCIIIILMWQSQETTEDNMEMIKNVMNSFVGKSVVMSFTVLFIAASGHYMLATTKFKQPDMVAHIVSPYILAGDNTCIQVYYQTQGGVLNIRTVATDSTLTTGTVH